tara:strand:+ start:205 stop:405 length:201 start_codon:yes stop_codon:yes gene_type:complete
MNEFKNVKIGDIFKISNTTYKVIDFYITKNNNNDIIRAVCLCEHLFLNQIIKSEKPFSSVVRYRTN